MAGINSFITKNNRYDFRHYNKSGNVSYGNCNTSREADCRWYKEINSCGICRRNRFVEVSMKRKIIYCINLLWTSIIAFSFPICFELIFLDITGHSKGYSYDFCPEKDVSIMFGCIELLIWIVLSVTSIIYIFRNLILLTIRNYKTCRIYGHFWKLVLSYNVR